VSGSFLAMIGRLQRLRVKLPMWQIEVSARIWVVLLIKNGKQNGVFTRFIKLFPLSILDSTQELEAPETIEWFKDRKSGFSHFGNASQKGAPYHERQ
jgi:hypothetical protein